MKELYLHAVVIKKEVGIKEAMKMAADIIKDKHKTFFRETQDSYRFRNIPKTQFDVKSFRTKKINDKVSLVFGHLKD